MNQEKDNHLARPGCRDIWNSYMVSDAHFSAHDIPDCPTTATTLPKTLITWEEAKSLYKKRLHRKEHKFIEDAFVCFYEDDYKFDGVRGIWHDTAHALEILHHFSGVITPDFSTYQDFPDPLKRYNTYRMRAFGHWLASSEIPVINNVRWGTPETYEYCFDGIPSNSIVAIGTCGGNPRKLTDRDRFENGLKEMVTRLHPHTIIVYGSANYNCFDELKKQGIQIVAYPSKTAKAFERRKQHE